MTMFETLDQLCLHEIADLMSAEKQILKALPGVIKKVSSPELKEALQDHLKQIETHVDRLKKVATLLGNESLRAQHCRGMEGLLAEGSEFAAEAEGDENVVDAGIIAGLRRVEHYEIAAYETLCVFLRQLGEDKAVTLLEETLDEENAADAKLSDIAEGSNTEPDDEMMDREMTRSTANVSRNATE